MGLKLRGMAMTTAAAMAMAFGPASTPIAAAQDVPTAIFTDPPHDPAHPARMEVIHIPSGGVAINGVVYVAAGAGPHPVVVLCHGLPGNEKNLDLAQAIRRAGWTVVTFNYRGSWGSPGSYSFANDLADARAVLAYLRTPAVAGTLGIDTTRIVLAGHSLGGWVTAMTAGRDTGLAGAILISAANLGAMGRMPRAALVRGMADNGLEGLAGTSPEREADELVATAAAYDFMGAAAGLKATPLLVLSADDGLSPMTDALATAVTKAGNSRVTALHVATDHGWSDARIRLAADVIRWLGALPK